ncbi:kinase-like domain-containing protein [Crepidotus variabilis]|uniref:Kinase-like domain-containing protein n=1 Tax=Crepidotus variabilis TaxID=179855 RepID=A0A9P6EE82_9AGAR|nr:kinase-like domain-containing protein [Crepidotus variabilis]
MGGPKYPKVVGFDLVQEIGGGAFSTVFRAVNISNQKVAACKVVLLTESTSEKERKNVEKEMRIHSALKQQHILEFLNAVVVELKHKATYIPGIYMLMEFAGGGDLFDKIVPDLGLDQDTAHYFFLQFLSGMHYIHSQGVCHRDLKPENILLDVIGNLKITDFGLSSVFRLKESGKTRALTERCGSLPYVAPELNSDLPYQAEPVDVWGVGVILFTLLAGNTPWDEPTGNSIEFVRYSEGTIFHEVPWNRLPELPLSLIRGLLTIDPAERMTLDDAFRHPWCIRPSQLAGGDPIEVAEMLIKRTRESGDLEIAAPDFAGQAMDVDEDEVMLSSTHHSQFTQTLMLFSQTQAGTRYTPHLTRFYATLAPPLLMTLVTEFLVSANAQCRPIPSARNERGREIYKIRVGGMDRRRERFKGWVEIEQFSYKGTEGSYCLMRRDEGNPISWRQLWKGLVKSDLVGPHVLRR